MQTLTKPTRRALLVHTRDFPEFGLKDGKYIITPDMPEYESIYQQCETAHQQQGVAIPYAVPAVYNAKVPTNPPMTARTGALRFRHSRPRMT